MIIGILKENPEETRVSILPEHISLLQKMKAEVWVEAGSGERSFAEDQKYGEAGATISDRQQILEKATILLSIHHPEASAFTATSGKVWLGLFQVLNHPDIIRAGESGRNTIFSLDLLPRTTRAQSMDVLSSQANIAGYKAVITGALFYPRYFPMFMTAAGSIPPAKVLILGAGVAGLQAIATAKRLGAVVEVFDTRPAVKEEVMSLGAKFVEIEGAADASKAGGYAVEQSEEFLKRQKEKIAESVRKADVIITTAQIPGKKAPVLITNEMIRNMRNGSVIIDLAAATGGNTEATENNQTITQNGVTIIGNSNLPATMPSDASKVYGKNICNFLQLIIDAEGQLKLNFEDDLVAGSCLTHNGQLINERVKSILNL
ncbi:MAG: NAD(P) transhydrogenase subunit alpha [Taibaiella sp.]|nr:NAD(P) transhydrogenase subunit alpha [Taibaiella sp.]